MGSFSAHNPTLTPHLAFITWHGAGLQAVGLADPTQPRSAAQFIPEPLPVVQTEVNIRNGLYILRYEGPFQREVARIEFLDGNSNSGDALRFESR